MSDADFAMLGFLFGYGAGHSDFFFTPRYYDRYISPAWSRYPGTYYGYGRAPVTRVTNYTTVIHNYDSVNASRITTAKADPKLSGYTDTKTGKSYTGTTVPAKAFSGGPSSSKSGGNATVSGTSGKSSGGGSWFGGGSSSGKGGYSPSRSSGGGRK